MALRPTEYFERNCFVGNSTLTRADIEQMDAQPIPNVMWGTDFPHFEGMWPHTRPRLQDLVCDVPETPLAPCWAVTLLTPMASTSMPSKISSNG